MQGLAAIVTSLIVGFVRLVPMNLNKKTDIVPVDYTVNALISVMWDTVNRYNSYILYFTQYNHLFLFYFLKI